MGHEWASRASALGVTEASGVCSTGGFLVVPIGRVIVERERERERSLNLAIGHTCPYAIAGAALGLVVVHSLAHCAFKISAEFSDR